MRTRDGGRTQDCRVAQILRYKHFKETPPSSPYLCQLMPTSSVLSCQSQVLENTPTPPACACVFEGKWDNLCVNAERSHNEAEQRAQSAAWCEFFQLLQESKGRRVIQHDCTSRWKQQQQLLLNSSFDIRMSVTLWVYRLGCVRVLGRFSWC